MKIDIHAHIADQEYLDDLVDILGLMAERTPDGKTLYRRNGYSVTWARSDMFDVDARLRDMDAKGIDLRVLSLSTPNVYPWPRHKQIEIARRINEALHRVCQAHPDRFIGFASLPLVDTQASLTEMDRSLNELDMKGIVIGSNIDGVQLDHPSFEPVWARIDALHLPVFEHPMFPKDDAGLEGFELPLRVGLIFDTTLSAARLIYSGIFERYKNFPYIMAHSGGALATILERLDNGYRLFPDCRRFISKLPSEYAKDLYYDTTVFGEKALHFLINVVGADHVLFGTDDPYINTDSSYVDRLSISETEKDKIFSINARRILGLGDSS